MCQQVAGQRLGNIGIGGIAGYVPGYMVTAVFSQQFGADRRPVVLDRRKPRHRGMTIRLQCREQGAFEHDARQGWRMIDRGNPAERLVIVGACLDPHRTLRRSRQHDVTRDSHADIPAPEPVEPCGCEQCRIDLARGELCQPCVDIAAKQDGPDIGPQPQQLCTPARRTRADRRALRQRIDACRTDQPVANIGARQHRRDPDHGGANCLDILHRMHRAIDLAVDQRPVEFLGPQRLAADVGQRPVLHPVAGGANHDDFDRVPAPAMRCAQRTPYQIRLDKGERRTTRTET